MKTAREPAVFGAWLIAPSVIVAFVLAPLCVIYGWPLNLIGWCFTSVGVALLVSRLVAAFTWSQQSGMVIEAEDNDGDQTVKATYVFGGETYLAEFSGAFRKSVGETVILFVNPKEPTSFMSFGIPLMLLAISFVVAGIVFGLSSPLYSFNWRS
jgi:hypothetical protein